MKLTPRWRGKYQWKFGEGDWRRLTIISERGGSPQHPTTTKKERGFWIGRFNFCSRFCLLSKIRQVSAQTFLVLWDYLWINETWQNINFNPLWNQTRISRNVTRIKHLALPQALAHGFPQYSWLGITALDFKKKIIPLSRYIVIHCDTSWYIVIHRFTWFGTSKLSLRERIFLFLSFSG